MDRSCLGVAAISWMIACGLFCGAAGGFATVQAGAGIVLDSVPQSEADETRNKARAVLRAIAQAHHAKEIF